MSSAASKTADAYAAQQVDILTSRVGLTDEQRQLVQSMFALTWFEGYTTGVKSTSEAITVVLSGSLAGNVP